MADLVSITFSATTVEGHAAQDPEVTVDIIQSSPDGGGLFHSVVSDFDGSATLTFPMPDGFPIWQANIAFSRYGAVSGFLFMPRGNSSPSWEIPLTRRPDAWTPEFTEFSSLDATRFVPFSGVIASSTAVDLKTDPGVFFDLDADYDMLAGDPQILAKAALLNLFAVCQDEIDPVGKCPWFAYVGRIVRIDQERFVAEAKSGIFESVTMIVNGLNGTFRNQGYFTEPDGGRGDHFGNIPAQYNASANLRDMKTLKKNFEQGNLQLTVSSLLVDGTPIFLLDCDLDEHANLILHGLDVLAHMFNGGTNPIFMHEYIVRDSQQSSPNGVATIDLGYDLA
jgi:hypothetical protein